MDRCALFVDAGYVLADGAMAVHGTRRRESVSWDQAGLLQLFGSVAMERTRLPLLRCYWYEATVDGRPAADHETLADLPGVKLRVARMRPGRREGVESEIRRDLTTLARNKAVSDVVLVSAEEDLAQVIADVQDMGLRVTLLHIELDGSWAASRSLRQECDDFVEISASHLRPYVELISGAEPPRPDESEAGPLGLRPAVNGNGHHMGGANGKAPATGRVVGYGQQGRPEPEIAPAPAQQEQGRPLRSDAAMAADFGAVPDLSASVDYTASVDYGTPADYPPVADQGPGAEYGAPAEYGPADFGRDTDYRVPAPAPAPQGIYAAPAAAVSPGGAGAGSAQVRRLPTRDMAPAGPANTPPGPPPTTAEVVLAGQPVQQPGDQFHGAQFQSGQFQAAQLQAAQFQGGQFQGGQPTGGQPVLPSPPIAAMEQNGSAGYAAARGGSHSGQRQSLQGPGGLVSLAGAGGPGGSPVSGPHPALGPGGPGGAASPGGPGGQVPPLGAPVTGVQQEVAVPSGPIGLVGPGGYPGGAPGVSLGDAVQSAHEEGQAFGESVARDAPALWLEAVLARKPRMPSDLEARLLQGSALPIDFLLHDEVRHALRRGFWDALERTRR